MSSSAPEILLVEDNQDDLELTLDALSEHHLASRIQVARDGVEALDFIFRRGDFSDRSLDDIPKVVLLDLKLPRVNGLEVLRQMKADPSTRRIPVVMLTSSREERDLIESYNLGVNSYIVKPVDFEQFNRTVGELGVYWVSRNQIPGA
jgi:CheY-like chemotaxis protein